MVMQMSHLFLMTYTVQGLIRHLQDIEAQEINNEWIENTVTFA